MSPPTTKNMKKFEMTPNSCRLIYRSGKKVLIFKKVNYTHKIIMPDFIMISKKNSTLQLNPLRALNSEEGKVFKDICHKLEQIFHVDSADKIYRKELILKGLGFKATMDTSNILILKLGYSHLIHTQLDNNIQVNIRDNILTFESKNKEKLGTFVSYLKSLKRPDSYKGRGLWQKYEIKTLKEIKKK